ncbi:hypothetical protein KUTeg_007539 [Tegillarca granosa]|uniref:Transmembrane protein n=1 Tax=Tegillarca granosa TaxID=220873 RepID=A0ABQ9FDL0_TEGGR|nr:hypothetical protein KUTeg_007539 [Tegillarca granosa]
MSKVPKHYEMKKKKVTHHQVDCCRLSASNTPGTGAKENVVVLFLNTLYKNKNFILITTVYYYCMFMVEYISTVIIGLFHPIKEEEEERTKERQKKEKDRKKVKQEKVGFIVPFCPFVEEIESGAFENGYF